MVRQVVPLGVSLAALTLSLTGLAACESKYPREVASCQLDQQEPIICSGGTAETPATINFEVLGGPILSLDLGDTAAAFYRENLDLGVHRMVVRAWTETSATERSAETVLVQGWEIVNDPALTDSDADVFVDCSDLPPDALTAPGTTCLP